MKKLFALLLAAVMLLCLLAGCNQQNASDDDDDNNSPADPFVDGTPAGTLYLTFGAAVEIVFDENGKALQITGSNETGKTIAAACQNQLNQECVFAARSLLRYASDNALIGDAKTVAVRLGKNDHMPKTDFLDTIITDCQYLCDEECTGLKMIRITAERLDEDGNLSLDCANSWLAIISMWTMWRWRAVTHR